MIKVGITHGDFNGISYEIIIKALMDKRLLEFFIPIIYGSSKIASYYRKTLNLTDINFNLIKKADYANNKRVNIINCYNEEVRIEIGKLTPKAGELAFLALEKAVEDLKWNRIDALVTAPINKKNIKSDKFPFNGHTDYLGYKFNADNHLMIMVNNSFRIGIVTGHIPLKSVSEHISTEVILNKITVMEKSLRMDFKIDKPKIAVLGLNPHASDEGIIGSEENEIIFPAIQQAKEENMLVFGPFPADGFFASSKYTNYDGILAMYHDQGMLPFKTLAFKDGVNFTAGLPIVRTSPAHGTAFDIAGLNTASPDSFREALYLAFDIIKNRKEFEELNQNPLQVTESENNNPPQPPAPPITDNKNE